MSSRWHVRTARDVRANWWAQAGTASKQTSGAAVYETHNDLSPTIRERMIALLDARLADATDQDTSDIFTEISRGTDKWLWMVEAHRQIGEWARSSEEREADAASGIESSRAPGLVQRGRP